jgi:hypothetical protein
VFFPALGAKNEFISSIEQKAEWGEYGSIIQSVPEFLQAVAPQLSALEKSVLHKHLGVAYFATGRADEARFEFIQAWENDSAVTLDKSMVSNEIYAFFTSTLESQKKAASEKAAKLALDKVKEDQACQQKLRGITARRRGDFAVVAFTVALAGLGAAAAYHEYLAAEEAYDVFKGAAASGDIRVYESAKADVKYADKLTVAGIAGSGVCALTATVFFVKWVKRVRQGTAIEHQGKSVVPDN